MRGLISKGWGELGEGRPSTYALFIHLLVTLTPVFTISIPLLSSMHLLHIRHTCFYVDYGRDAWAKVNHFGRC